MYLLHETGRDTSFNSRHRTERTIQTLELVLLSSVRISVRTASILTAVLRGSPKAFKKMPDYWLIQKIFEFIINSLSDIGSYAV
jgi:hypothetical protein